MLARGEPIGAVLASFLGTCSAGRAAEGMWLSFLSTLPTLHVRRSVLEHFLRTFNGARLHGAQWRVVDSAGFVGRQHNQVPREPLERVDPETGEYSFERPHGYPSAPDWTYCPGESAGGLAALSDRSPRQLNRYRHALRAGKLMASKQPPYDAPDATRPRRANGKWAYAQHWLRVPPTPEMLARWRGRPAETRRRPQVLSQMPFSAAQAPRAAELQDMAELVEIDFTHYY